MHRMLTRGISLRIPVKVLFKMQTFASSQSSVSRRKAKICLPAYLSLSPRNLAPRGFESETHARCCSRLCRHIAASIDTSNYLQTFRFALRWRGLRAGAMGARGIFYWRGSRQGRKYFSSKTCFLLPTHPTSTFNGSYIVEEAIKYQFITTLYN